MQQHQPVGIWSGDSDLIARIRYEAARGNFQFTVPGNGAPRMRRVMRPKHHNQMVKAQRRLAQGRSSYRQRQASARAAKTRQSPPVPV